MSSDTLPLSLEAFTREPPLAIPTAVARGAFTASELVHTMDISRSALSRYDGVRGEIPYPYIPHDYTEILFVLAEKKHIDLLAAINEWFSDSGVNFTEDE